MSKLSLTSEVTPKDVCPQIKINIVDKPSYNNWRTVAQTLWNLRDWNSPSVQLSHWSNPLRFLTERRHAASALGVMTIMQPRWLGVISVTITMPLEFPCSPQCILQSPGKSAFILLHCRNFLLPLFVLYQEGRQWLIIGIIALTVFFIIHKSTQSLYTPWISQRLWLPPPFICWGLRCTACPRSAP